MKELLLTFAATVAALTLSAQGVVTFSQVNNENDMLFYASTATPDSQLIITDAQMVPAVAALGLKYSIPQYIVECLATPADLANGDASKSKEGAETRTVVPANAKLMGLSLPGRYFEGTSNILVETTYMSNIGTDVAEIPYKDMPYYDYESILTSETGGYATLNEPQEAVVGDNSMVFSVPFSTPFVYAGGNMDVAIGLHVKDYDRVYTIKFDFAQTAAQTSVATAYHSFAQGQNMSTSLNFYVGCDLGLPAAFAAVVQSVIDYLDLQNNTLPAFQFDFYTNDIRGQLTENGNPVAGKTVELYSIDATGERTLVDTYTADENGNFEFLNLDENLQYVLEVQGETLTETVIDFGDNAIENDVNVVVELTPVSAVEGVNAAKSIASVTYCNMAGVRSAQPFSGINLVETRYSDGSTQVTKVIR